MLLRFFNPNDLIGCGGGNEPIRSVFHSINQSDSYQCGGENITR